MIHMAERHLTGRHVLAILVGFFGVVFLVNGAFVYLALESWTGLESPHAFTEGLHYNRVLEDAERQRALGWDAMLSFDPVAPHTVAARVEIHDRDGVPVDGLTVTLGMRRPASDRFDRVVDLPASGRGAYDAEVAFPLAGNWDLHVTALEGGEQRYVVVERLWVK